MNNYNIYSKHVLNGHFNMCIVLLIGHKTNN